VIRSALVRTSVVVSLLLLTGCAAIDDAPSPEAAGPTTPSDTYAVAACLRLNDAMEGEDLHFMTSVSAGRRAFESKDGRLQDAGRRLVQAGKEGADISVHHPEQDLGPVRLRVAEAQRNLLAECTEMFGAPPWNFATPVSLSGR
jgi:hypothetical protein